jgi:hypothetical protein
MKNRFLGTRGGGPAILVLLTAATIGPALPLFPQCLLQDLLVQREIGDNLF